MNCYICGRDEKKVQDALVQALIARIEDKNAAIDDKVSVENSKKNALNNKILEMRKAMQNLPSLVKKMKILSIKGEADLLISEYPELEQVLELADELGCLPHESQALLEVEAKIQDLQSENSENGTYAAERKTLSAAAIMQIESIKKLKVMTTRSVRLSSNSQIDGSHEFALVRGMFWELYRGNDISAEEAVNILYKCDDMMNDYINNESEKKKVNDLRHHPKAEKRIHALQVDFYDRHSYSAVVPPELFYKRLGFQNVNIRGVLKDKDKFINSVFNGIVPDTIDVPICSICNRLVAEKPLG